MKRALLSGLAAAVVVLGVQARAEAEPIVQFKFVQGGTTFTSGVFAGNDITYTAFIGDYLVQVIGSWTHGTLAGGSSLQSNSTTARRLETTAPDPLEVYVTAFDYDLPMGLLYSLDSTHTATKEGTPESVPVPVDFQAYIDFGNVPFGTENTNGMISCTPAGGISQDCAVNGPSVSFEPGAIPFSVTTKTIFNIKQDDTTSQLGTTSQAIVNIVNVPEPASVLLLGAGVMGLAAFCRRRQ